MVVQERTYRKVPLEAWEIGAELLDILSRGLYTDAKDAIREYVQNGVDANASSVTVSINGPRVTIRDDGDGMDWDTLRMSRRFGVSDKSPKLHVGYRGIGIYAAFGMCEILRITTRQVEMDDLLHLQIRFGEMRRILEQDKASEKREGIGLSNLLYEYTEFRREPYTGDTSRDHFTLVRLDGISREYRAQLNDSESVEAYLLNTLPIAFPEEEYGITINAWLKEYVGLNSVKLVLRVGNEPEINVEPKIAPHLEDPQFHWIKDDQNKKVAFIWNALTTLGERIPSLSGSDEATGVSGFLLKMKGFTLGDRIRLKPRWPATGGRTLYHHYTGEAHVLDAADVYPSAARDDLEASAAKQERKQTHIRQEIRS